MKRTLAIAAAALALAVIPAAAQAYPVPSVGSTVTNPAPAPGEAVLVSASGLVGATTATLTVTSAEPAVPDAAITIAGSKALTKPVSDEKVTFTVTLAQAGTHYQRITTDNGLALDAPTITVGDSSGGGTSGGGTSAPTTQAGGPTLPETGASGMAGIAGLAGGLLIAGTAGTLLVRRGARQRG